MGYTDDQLEKKIFWLIVPALCIDYIFYYVDKTTLSYAALFGIREDLKLVGTKYSTLSSIFYVGWLVWAFPGNILMLKFPLAKYIAANVSRQTVYTLLTRRSFYGECSSWPKAAPRVSKTW